jgi:hypothetical protein
VSRFEAVLDKLEDGVKVYLSTDDKDVAKQLCKKYGKRIVYVDKPLGSDTREGMLWAIIDLYLLNRCGQIFGTHTSSFNWMAGVIDNDVPVVCVAGK